VALCLETNIPHDRHFHGYGTARNVGEQFGSFFKKSIHKFLNDGRARLVPILGKRYDSENLRASIEATSGIVSRQVPTIAAEISGLAEGAEIAISDAYLLQLRRELAGYQPWSESGDCTSFVKRAQLGNVAGQTIDLNGSLHSEITALDLTAASDHLPALLVSYTGLLGYIGMNAKGLCITINLTLGGIWRPGLPGYMIVRHLLNTASSVADCRRILENLPRSSSRCMTLIDTVEAATVEYTPEEVRWIGAEVHANHFQAASFQAADKLNPFAKAFSLRREASIRHSLEASQALDSTSALHNMMQRPPVFVRDTGVLLHECTVATVVFRPADRLVSVQAIHDLRGDIGESERLI